MKAEISDIPREKRITFAKWYISIFIIMGFLWGLLFWVLAPVMWFLGFISMPIWADLYFYEELKEITKANTEGAKR